MLTKAASRGYAERAGRAGAPLHQQPETPGLTEHLTDDRAGGPQALVPSWEPPAQPPLAGIC